MIEDYKQEQKDIDLEFRLRKTLDQDMLVCELTGSSPTFLVERDYVEYLKVHRRIESKYSFFIADSYHKQRSDEL